VAPRRPWQSVQAAELRFPSERERGTLKTLRPLTPKVFQSKIVPLDLDIFLSASLGDESGFDLEFDKQASAYSWKALDVEEKKRFLSTLINLSARHQKSKVSVSNLPKDVIIVDQDSVIGSDRGKESSSGQWPLMNKDNGGEGLYEPISSKEAADLMALMQKCDNAVTKADKFMDDLSRELNILDGANIHSIMASEENIDKYE
jgi:hypothetical protein